MANKTTDTPVEAPVVADTVDTDRPTCCLNTDGTCTYCKDNYCQGCGKNTTPLDA